MVILTMEDEYFGGELYLQAFRKGAGRIQPKIRRYMQRFFVNEQDGGGNHGTPEASGPGG
jgi:hypothetical protein